jgi:hypothetical protein
VQSDSYAQHFQRDRNWYEQRGGIAAAQTVLGQPFVCRGAVRGRGLFGIASTMNIYVVSGAGGTGQRRWFVPARFLVDISWRACSVELGVPPRAVSRDALAPTRHH